MVAADRPMTPSASCGGEASAAAEPESLALTTTIHPHPSTQPIDARASAYLLIYPRGFMLDIVLDPAAVQCCSKTDP